MSVSMLVDRNALGASPTGAASAGPATASPANHWCVVPRCEIRVEKCEGGCKLTCCCEDDVACGTLQNLCRMLASGQCSVCCQLNGVTVCDCKFACGFCRCEFTEDGCCITCTTGDQTCCEIIQACCETIACCLKNGCCCYLCFNGTPVCCAC